MRSIGTLAPRASAPPAEALRTEAPAAAAGMVSSGCCAGVDAVESVCAPAPVAKIIMLRIVCPSSLAASLAGM
jgi:hypothetical protein